MKQDVDKRWKEHIAKGKPFKRLEVQYSGLTKNQAHALEQYYIENGPNEFNIINSISKSSEYYEQAMKWAKNYLK